MDRLGVALAFMSAILMATIGVFSKHTGLAPEIITFFRLFLGALFMALFLLTKGELYLIWKWPSWPVAFCGVFLAGFMSCYIQAMNYTSMANTIMLVYLAPFVAAIVAHFLLGEKLSLRGSGLILLALFGFAMMMELRMEYSSDSKEFIGICFGLLALVCYSGFILVNRMIPSAIHSYTSTFWQLFIGGLVIVPMICGSMTNLEIPDIPWLAAIGFFPGFLAILCAVLALNRLPAAMFGTIAYTEAVAVVVFGWSLFGESLGLMQIAGCALIIISSLLKTTLKD